MHLGETIDEVFVREIKEETGLVAQKGELLHVDEAFFTDPNTDQHFQTLLLYYTGHNAVGDISTKHLDESEKVYVREAQWIPLTEVASLKFYNPVDSVLLIRKAAELQHI